MNKLYDLGIIVIVAVLLATAVGTIAHKFSQKAHHSGKEEFKGHDQKVEEISEDFYEFLTQEKIDFTPDSPEESENW